MIRNFRDKQRNGSTRPRRAAWSKARSKTISNTGSPVIRRTLIIYWSGFWNAPTSANANAHRVISPVKRRPGNFACRGNSQTARASRPMALNCLSSKAILPAAPRNRPETVPPGGAAATRQNPKRRQRVRGQVGGQSRTVGSYAGARLRDTQRFRSKKTALRARYHHDRRRC